MMNRDMAAVVFQDCDDRDLNQLGEDLTKHAVNEAMLTIHRIVAVAPPHMQDMIKCSVMGSFALHLRTNYPEAFAAVLALNPSAGSVEQ